MRVLNIWSCAALVCLPLIVFVAHEDAHLTLDSMHVIQGSRAVVECIADGVLERCDQRARAHQDTTAAFALLQYLPAIALTWSGLSDDGALRGLRILSAVAFAGLALLLALVGRRTGRLWAPPLLVLTVLAGPMVWYATAGFGEMLAAFLTAAFAVAALLRSHPAVLVALLWSAGITKETAPLLLVVIGAIALWATPIAARPLRGAHWAALTAGTALAAATNLAFNWLRWGSLENVVYAPDANTSGLVLRAKYSASLWSAPNAGMLEFWSVATVLLAATVAIGLAGLLRRREDVRAWLPAGGVAVVLVLHTGIQASWWQPFGWAAWGPRLMLPLIPTLVVLAVVVYAGHIERGLRWLGRSVTRTAAAALVVVGVALPHVGALYEPTAVIGLFTVDERCPRFTGQAELDLHHRCNIHLAWRRHSVLVDAYSGTTKGLGPFYAVVFATAWAALVVAAVRPNVWPCAAKSAKKTNGRNHTTYR